MAEITNSSECIDNMCLSVDVLFTHIHDYMYICQYNVLYLSIYYINI